MRVEGVGQAMPAHPVRRLGFRPSRPVRIALADIGELAHGEAGRTAERRVEHEAQFLARRDFLAPFTGHEPAGVEETLEELHHAEVDSLTGDKPRIARSAGLGVIARENEIASFAPDLEAIVRQCRFGNEPQSRSGRCVGDDG